MRGLACSLACLATVLVLPQDAATAPFTPGNLAVYRVGTGSATLSSSATAVFVDEYTTSGSLVQSFAMPTVDAGANQMLTSSGLATTEGYLTRSLDGRYLMLTGYDAALGTSVVASTNSAVVNRVVGRLDHHGGVNSSTVFDTAYDQGSIRGAASTNGADVWTSGAGIGGSGGVWHTTIGGSADIQVSSTVTNTRSVLVASNQLFISSASGTVRVATVGTGLPTNSGNPMTNLPGSAIPALGNPHAYFFADLSPITGFGSTGLDTLYVADEMGTAAVKKFTFNGTNWVADGSQALTSVRGLTGTVSGTSVTLYATTGTSLQRITDTSGFDGAMNGSFTLLANAGADTAFRGVALAPVPEPGSLILSGLALVSGMGGLAVRSRRRTA